MTDDHASDGEHEGDRLPSHVFRLLASENRRKLLELLADDPDATHRLDDLVERISERAGDSSDPVEWGERADRLRTALHHTDLPKLDEADVVEYDPTEQRVRYVGDDVLETYLESID